MNRNIYDKRRSSSKVNFIVLIVYKVSEQSCLQLIYIISEYTFVRKLKCYTYVFIIGYFYVTQICLNTFILILSTSLLPVFYIVVQYNRYPISWIYLLNLPFDPFYCLTSVLVWKANKILQSKNILFNQRLPSVLACLIILYSVESLFSQRTYLHDLFKLYSFSKFVFTCAYI